MLDTRAPMPVADTTVEFSEQFQTDPDGTQHSMGHCYLVRCNRHGTVDLAVEGQTAFSWESDPALFCPHCADALRKLEAPVPTDLDVDRHTDLQRIRQDEDRERRLDAR